MIRSGSKRGRDIPAEHALLLLSVRALTDPEALEEVRRVAPRCDWDRLTCTAARVGALPLHGAALEAALVPAPVAAAGIFRQARVNAAARILLMERIQGEVVEACGRAGIPCLVLKGLPLAHELYPSPDLRPPGDLDLLVRRPDRDRALEVLQTAGFVLPAGSLPLRFYWRHHFHVTLVRPGFEGLPIELHWDTQPPFSLSRIPADDFWAEARFVLAGSRAVQVPRREAHLLYLAQHLGRHLLDAGDDAAGDPVAALLDPAVRGRLVWLADLWLLLSPPATDFDRTQVDCLAARWGVTGDFARAQARLDRIATTEFATVAATGTVESTGRSIAPAPARGFPGGWRRRAAALLPGLGRTSASLQLRPVQAIAALRYAFPGRPWIRWRYGLETVPAATVLARGFLHAAGAILRLLRMAVAAGIAWLVRSRTQPQHHDPPTPSGTHPGNEIYPAGGW